MALKYWLRGSVLRNNIPILSGLAINIGKMSDKTNVATITSSLVDGTFEYEVPEVETLITHESVIRTGILFDSLSNTPVLSIGLVTDGVITYTPYDEGTGLGDYRVSAARDGIEWMSGIEPEMDTQYFVDYYYYSESYFVTAFYTTDQYNAKIFDYVKPTVEEA